MASRSSATLNATDDKSGVFKTRSTIDRWDQMVALDGGSGVRTANPEMKG
ncbi:hypothetical protein [Paenibacillus alba]|uniref:Uncharacterized protein n=1 Tax=Paenibacillus alba TaxID=1197127 RepID=A0ABU6G0Y4_9BACL|nr:hypothetical protein [Paenibacillus alba]MEC0227823.1 hypothetical protein [Paenibacillus alba]